MKTSPTQRSLKWLRDNGYTAQIVERWNAHAGVRQDLFGGIDIIALRFPTDPRVGEVETAGIQTTSDANVAARRAKMLDDPRLRLWVECGNTLVIHGWGKKGARGKRKTWTLREVRVTLGDFARAPGTEIYLDKPGS